MRSGRVVLVCSPGGHLLEMLSLEPAYRHLDETWVTLPCVDVEHLLAGRTVFTAHGPTNRSLVKLLRNLPLAWNVVRRHDPDVIIATGAGLAVPFFLIGRLLRRQLVYVESLARSETLSLTGRLVYPLADHFFVQWPQLARRHGKARYEGNVLSPLDATERHRPSAGRPRLGAVRVLHVGPDVKGTGGMAAVVRNLLASPLSERHRLSFVRTYGSAHPVSRALTFALALPRIALWCLGPGPRIVHIHTAIHGSWYRKAICTAMVKALRRPVILHFHVGAGDIRAFDERLGTVLRRLIGWSFSLADRVLAVSNDGARELERLLALGDVTVVPNPAPPIPVPAVEPRGAGAAVDVLYLGGFANHAKGGDVLLEALPEVLASCPQARVTLAGPGPLPATAGRVTDSPAVRWDGYLHDAAKDAALRRAQLFVLPSRSEGLPVALLEAMAYSSAIVGTRAGGIPEVLTDGVSGVLVEPEDAGALAEAVVTWAHDPDRRARLAAAARRRAEQFNGSEVVDRLDRVYRELVT
jgi:glycosyltransferase involved in cell wall biosynthesis